MAVSLKDFLIYVPQTNNFDIMNANLKLTQSIKALRIWKVVNRDNRLLDAIAYDEYGDENYWWVILYYNSIVDPFTMDGKTQISLPYKTEIDSLYINLKQSNKTNIERGSS